MYEHLLSKLLAEKDELQRKIEENAANLAELSGEDLGKSLVERASDAIRDIPPLRWHVNALFHAVGFGVIASPPFVGKTFLAAHIAGALSAGRPLFGHFKPNHSMPVLYVYYESNRAEFLWGIKRSLESRGISGDNFFVKTAKTPADRMKVGSSGLEAAIRATQAKFVVLDTLAFANPGDESNDDLQAKLVEPLVSLAERLECFVLLVHHSSKASAEVEGIYKLRGGTTLPGAADVILRIERIPNDPVDSKRRRLVMEKVRGAPAGFVDLELDFGRKIAWAVDQDPREVLWEPKRYELAKLADPFEEAG